MSDILAFSLTWVGGFLVGVGVTGLFHLRKSGAS